jgi:hypothetical protein
LSCQGNGKDMLFTIIGALALIVLIGSATMICGVRYFNLPSRVLTIAFALTAASWMAFLIAAISAIVLLLAPANV